MVVEELFFVVVVVVCKTVAISDEVHRVGSSVIWHSWAISVTANKDSMKSVEWLLRKATTAS